MQAALTGSFLIGTDMTAASVTGTDLNGAYYSNTTVFPSGNTYELSPWDAGMIPVPEASFVSSPFSAC